MQRPLNFAVRLELVARYLVPSSILYLALPYVIFCVWWLQWYWALLGIGLLTVAFTESTRLAFRKEVTTESAQEISPRFTFNHALALLLFSLVWLIFAGVGGIGYQRGDWIKHESILKDLIEHSWPVLYDFYSVPVPLVYYLAYYLPAALVGKIAGWEVAQYALFLWTYFGINLAMLWFWVLVRKLSYVVLLLFIFFSGLDVVGKGIIQAIGWATTGWERIERWVPDLEYSANTVLLYWVPQHALSGWIASGLILYAILYLRHKSITWLVLGLSALWSPFVTVGLVPYVALEFFSDDAPWRARLRRYLSWPNVCGLALLFLIGLFYMSKMYEVSPSMVNSDIEQGFFFSVSVDPPLRALISLLIFWLVEVGIYAILIRKSMMSEDRLWQWLALVTLLSLSLMPLYKLGHFNDFLMRSSIPALFCLVVLVGRTVYRTGLSMVSRVALIIALLFGAGTSISELSFNVTRTVRLALGLPIEQDLALRGIVELYQGIAETFLQYVGGYEAPFFRYFVKQQDWASEFDQRRYIAYVDHAILFESYQLEKDSALRPGEQIEMISKLNVFSETVNLNYDILLRLVAEEGNREVWKGQGWDEIKNERIARWDPSVHWSDIHQLAIPVDAAEGFYRLELGFVNKKNHDLSPAFAVSVETYLMDKYLGEMVPIGYLTVGDIESRPDQLFAQPPQLGDQMALAGITLPLAQGISPGDSLHIELFWQAIAEMEQDYTGFVHLIAADGSLVAQNDHQPRNGFLPTTIWKPGLTLADDYTILVPQDAPPGSYSLVAGLYDLESGKRLPVHQEGRSEGDSIVLMKFDMQ